MTEPTRDEVRETLTSHAEEYEHWAAHEDETVVRDTYLRSAALYRLALALLDEGEKDRERLDWMQAASVDPLEVDNFGAGVGDPDPRDRVFLTWVNSGDRIAADVTLRAAIDQARGA